MMVAVLENAHHRRNGFFMHEQKITAVTEASTRSNTRNRKSLRQ